MDKDVIRHTNVGPVQKCKIWNSLLLGIFQSLTTDIAVPATHVRIHHKEVFTLGSLSKMHRQRSKNICKAYCKMFLKPVYKITTTLTHAQRDYEAIQQMK